MKVNHGWFIFLINAAADPRVCAATCKWGRKPHLAHIWRRDAPTRATASVGAQQNHAFAQRHASGPWMAHLAHNKSEPADKPGSVVDNHSSGTGVTTGLLQPTRRHRGPRFSLPIWSCFRWGLPSHRVLPLVRCALTAPFHPYLRPPVKVGRRYIFCCTVRRLTPPRSYLAPCPAKPGLSSPQNQRIHSAVAWPAPGPIFLQ